MASQPPEADSHEPVNDFECIICRKAFARKDLRDRHKRRCAASSGKPRRSKRVSCLACVASKLGCDLERPSCSRCVQRDVQCCYADSQVSQSRQASRAPRTTPLTSQEQPIHQEQNQHMLFATLHYDGENSRQADAARREIGKVPQVEGWPELQPSAPSPATQQAFDAGRGGTNCSIGLTDSFGLGDFSVLDTMSQSLRLHESLIDFTGGDRDSRRVSSHDTIPPRLGDGSMVDSGRIATLVDAWRQSPADPPIINPPRHDIPLTPPSSVDTDDKLIQIIRRYPRMMLGQGDPPPFVHRFYPYVCGASEVPEPLAKALCCISAFHASLSSSRSFVYKLINVEREQLTQSFMLYECHKDTLASIHAMIAYQIMGLFDSDPEQVKIAILYNHHLTMMMSKFARLHYSNLIPEDTTKEMPWQKWVLYETIRRTVFMVHVINVLSARLIGQNRFFYEPLDEDLVLDLPVPAPDSMFRAEWDNLSSSPMPTTTTSVTVGKWRQEIDATGFRIEDQQLDEFTRLILATSGGSVMDHDEDEGF